MINFLADKCPYDQYARPLGAFCEENLCAYITQPANAWSNVAYILAGLYLIYRFKNYHLSKIFGFLAISIGLTSFIYHATFTLWSEFLDLGSMLIFTSFLLSLNIWRFKKQDNIFSVVAKLFSLILFLSLVILYLTGIYTGGYELGKFIFGFEILLILGFEFLIRSKGKRYQLGYLVIAVSILFTSWFIWLLDRKEIWCDGSTFHFVNGHVIWHFLTAIALTYSFLFYKQFFILKNKL